MINLNCKQHFSTLQLLRIQQSGLHLAAQQEGKQEEKKERELLRKEYIASVRMNLRAQLDNVDVQQEDGTIINLGEKYGIKKRH